MTFLHNIVLFLMLFQQLIACSLLTALLNEFSSNTKSSGAGFTWEFHIRCKRHFEVGTP